jgi:hypothetical protein
MQQLGVVALLAAAGVLLAVAPRLVVTGAIIGGIGVSLVAIVRRYDVIPTTADEWAIGVGALLLPVVPWIETSRPGLGQALRVAIAAVLWASIGFGRLRLRAPAKYAWLIAGFAVLQLCAAMVGIGGGYGAVRLMNWLMFVPLALLPFTPRTLRVAVAGATGAVGLLVVGVVLQAAGVLAGTWGGVELSHGYATRYTSFLLNPNDLGLFMLGAAAVAFVTARSPMVGVARGAGPALFVILTGSRGAFIALPILALYLLFARGGKSMVAVAVVATVVYLSSPFIVPGAANSIRAATASVGTVMSGNDESISLRRERWNVWLQRHTNPISGSGYGGYTPDRDVVLHQTDRQQAYRALTVDNSWLKLYLEEGLVGVVLLASVLLFAIRRTLAIKSDVAAAVGALVVLLAFRSLSTDILDINPWNFYLWLLLGVAFSLDSFGMRPRASSAAEEAGIAGSFTGRG